MRVGIGYDSHRFADGRKLILGGVVVPHTQGLAGHSDADVVAHAVTDALLGAAGLGDIGQLFPDTDAAYAGADSMELLGAAVALVAQHGWKVDNVDVTVVAEAPRLAPHRAEWRRRLGEAIGEGEVNVRATTTDRLGFTGRGEGLAAQAVALLSQ